MNKKTTLSVRAEKIFVGRLKERSYVADYGDIGGLQTVNCRLAVLSLYNKSSKNDYTINFSVY